MSDDRSRIDAALARLRERFGEVPVEAERTDVDAGYLDRLRERAAGGWLGGAGAWVADGERVLFVRHEADPETWRLPGGHHDPGETLVETAERTVRAATGVQPVVAGVWLVRRRTLVGPDGESVEGLDVRFEATPETQGYAITDDAVLDVRWFGPADPPETLEDEAAERVRAWATTGE